ncbi:MAG: tRNA guanosine(34) transglycosylase Tgt [Desulfobacterales bacterium]
MPNFTIVSESKDTRARSGRLQTAHGTVETPVFMPVGTLASVKAVSPEELVTAGAQIILGNTYHLYLRPGSDVIDRFSGLHRFMHWDRPILTDSGGFQVFSLAKLSKTSEAGVTFQSHIDGSTHQLSPEKAIELQRGLNSDIAMCLDVCTPYPASREETASAATLTSAWAGRCKKTWVESGQKTNALFAVVQGGMFHDLRDESAEALIRIGFDGYAVGGLSVGEPKGLMLDVATHILPRLPAEKPKYVMGVGTPEDLVDLVGLGADMFDCVIPTRNARNGQLFTTGGTLNIANARFKADTQPIDADCTCTTCQHYSRAYLRHLYMARELFAYRLNTIHNIHYYTTLMSTMRDAINRDEFDAFQKAFYRKREKPT